jgi:hypothetical protein
MKAHAIFTSAAATLLIVGGTAGQAKAPPTWDGLVQVDSKRLEYVYLQPGADFRTYTKVLIEPTEIAFHKDWRRDYNRTAATLASRVSEADVQRAVSKGVEAAHDIFVDAWTKAGYPVVDTPGPDVLRVKTGIVNIRVSAPDKHTVGRSFSFSEDTGQATLFIEARDSLTGALLGRAVDPKVVGDSIVRWRTSASNRADFRDQVQMWADASVRGMAELKSSSPINP